MAEGFRLNRDALRRKLLAGLSRGAAYLTSAATTKLPLVNTGALRRSVGWQEVEGEVAVYWGVDERLAPYARYIEFGFMPHFAPFSASRSLAVWARRVAPQWLTAGGVFVGGPGSRLQSSPAGAYSPWRRGGWYTEGGVSPLLPPGKVGYPFLRPALLEAVRSGRFLSEVAAGLRREA